MSSLQVYDGTNILVNQFASKEEVIQVKLPYYSTGTGMENILGKLYLYHNAS
jgi:23S rRNA maturation mini-RNase III